MILITGATGLIGRSLVNHLAACGWPLRVYVRPARHRRGRAVQWPEAVEEIVGTLDDHASLHQAMREVHTVFHLASAQWGGRPRDLEQVDVQGTRNVIAAARAARVGRLFFLSQLGAEPASAYDLLRAKGQIETLVRNSGIAYTILRCGIVFGPDDRFVNGLAMVLRSNPVVVFQPGAGESLLHPLYVEDLVHALERSLQLVDLVDTTIEVGGAEYVTYNELVRTVMRVSGARRMIVSLPPYALRSLNGMLRRLVRRWPVTPPWFDLLASNRTAKLGNLYDYCGVRPARFEDTLLTYMPQRRYGLDLLRYITTGTQR